MTDEALRKSFAKIGARVKFEQLPEYQFLERTGAQRKRLAKITALLGLSEAPENRFRDRTHFTIDVGRDSTGEFFQIARDQHAPDLQVLQIAPRERHLLLYARKGRRILCGHDERHLFVAGVSGRVNTVRAA